MATIQLQQYPGRESVYALTLVQLLTFRHNPVKWKVSLELEEIYAIPNFSPL